MPADPLRGFSVPTTSWFEACFPAPTAVQAGTWEAAQGGRSVLAAAPTGSGKTLAAFLAAVDRLLVEERRSGAGVRVLYVSPLKALAYDIDRNLRAPLVGIRHAAERT
jgi:ATP-dependent helicase Lhr and Lhr-like helicase